MNATRLTPTPVRSLTQAADVAFDGVRRRPVIAQAGDQLVVCAARTARKHGWVVTGRLFQRTSH